MQSFKTLLQNLEGRLAEGVFPTAPKNLYAPANYILQLGGKHIRPVICLMGAELFGEISEDAYKAALAIELFHNFTLIHDDIMDEAPLRRGKSAVHQKYGANTALLAGDVMLVQAYDLLHQITHPEKSKLLGVFSRAAREVCEGQQLDMDLEQTPLEEVKLEDYLQMIVLKTSVLLAASLKIGGLIGRGNEQDLALLYAFGKNIGIAFQVQDDYLDAFGDPRKFGKQVGGDILANKKTFLLIKAYELSDISQKKEILSVLTCEESQNKISKMLEIYKSCKIDQWAQDLKKHYVALATEELKQINISEERKRGLEGLMEKLFDRER